MSNLEGLESALSDPRLLEELYQKALQASAGAQFAAEIARRHEAAPDNPLLAAWYYRLQAPAATVMQLAHRAWRIQWPLAVPLGIILGIFYWVLSGQSMTQPDGVPYLLFLWAPLAAAALIAYLVLGAQDKTRRQRALVVAVAVLAAAAYAVLVSNATNFKIVAAIHLVLLSWIGIGLIVAGSGSDDRNRFAFLIKSTEAVVTGGIYGGAAVLFLGVTFGIFQAIGVTFSDTVMRLGPALVAGLVPLLGVATVYDPRFVPIEQRFEDGLSKLISALGRFFLPLTLVVGIVYVVAILFNFEAPFKQRDVLIVYNLMLFAVMGLLVFATPVSAEGLSNSVRLWLRRGILVVAALTVFVSLYALSATVYRTFTGGGLTINRTTIIGWNVINIGILVHLLVTQGRAGQEGWLPAEWRTARLGMIAYAVWSVFLLLALPWLF
jgi:hypothetical protein